jgi:chromosome segregation ATPase
LLGEIEKDDEGMSLVERVNKFNDYNLSAHARLNAAKDAFLALNRLKDEASQCKGDLVPLQDANNGTRAVIGQTQVLQDELNKRLDWLETIGEERLTTRVELLLKSKRETEQRMAGLSECLTTIQTIRNDFITLKEKQAQVERSLVEAETDDKGRGLVERLNDLNDFMTQAHARLADLQNTLLRLNGIRADLVRCQTDLDQLRKPDEGILSIIGEAQSQSDQLVKCLEELELGGEIPFAARMESLLQNKRESDLRIEALKAAFSELEMAIMLALRGFAGFASCGHYS